MRVDPREFERIQAELQDPPRIVEQLIALAKRVSGK